MARDRVVPLVDTARAADETAPILRVRDLSVEFDAPGGPLRAVDGVSFDLHRGETLGLVGESGCGKTTTVLGIMRLLPPGGRIVSGSVWFDGEDLLGLDGTALRAFRWTRLSLVFQGAMNALNPVRTVGDQISEAVRLHAPGTSEAEGARRAGSCSSGSGSAGVERRSIPHTYSGGMRQRAMIALALACDPDVIVADEPTTALDVMIQAQILELLSGIARDFGMAIILVTHDLGVVAQVCDRIVVMYGGGVAEENEAARLFRPPQHPYTQQLLQSFPDLAHPDRPLRGIPGAPPRLDAMPPGCRFAAALPARVRAMSARAAARLRDRGRPRGLLPPRSGGATAMTDALLRVEDLAMEFPGPQLVRRLASSPAGAGRARRGWDLVRAPRRRGARARRRVGLREDDDRQPAHGPPDAERRPRGARRRGGRQPLRQGPAAPSAAGPDGLPGPLRVAQPADDGGRDRGRTTARAPRRAIARRASHAGDPRDDAGRAGPGRCLPASVSLRAVRRAAPARRRRRGPGARALAAGCGRAGQHARRQHPCRDPQPALRTRAERRGSASS